MSNFKKVIEIEKKYDHVVGSSKKKSEKDLDKFKEELILKEEALKQDYVKELEKNYLKAIKDFNTEGENIIKKSKIDAKYILDNAKKEDAKKILIEEVFKNV